MAVSIENGRIVVPGKRPMTRAILQTCLDRHIAEDPLTKVVEEYAEGYVAAGFPARGALLLVRLVFAWGGARPNNYVRVYEENCGDGFATLSRQLQFAHEQSLLSNHVDAVDIVAAFKGISISFGSKLLRFLCPNNAVVLDKRIRERCGYEETSADYARFIQDCALIRDELDAAGFRRKGGAPWRCCDIEMAIYKYVEVRA